MMCPHERVVKRKGVLVRGERAKARRVDARAWASRCRGRVDGERRVDAPRLL